MITFGSFVQEARQKIPASETPALDVLVLLEWISGIDRSRLLAEQNTPLEELISGRQLHRFEEALAQRATGRPVAYIIGTKEFYGFSFSVGPGVLIPRPDTEVLVDRAIEIFSKRQETSPLIIHDCCTGTGCIGISIAKVLSEEYQQAINLSLSDLDPKALEWARRNVQNLLSDNSDQPSFVGTAGVHVEICRRELLVRSETQPTDTHTVQPHLICANPPYLTEAETVTALKSGWGEPSVALAAGDDGMTILRKLIPQAFSQLRHGGYLLVEHGSSQGDAVIKLCRDAGFHEVRQGHDLADNDRYVEARKARH